MSAKQETDRTEFGLAARIASGPGLEPTKMAAVDRKIIRGHFPDASLTVLIADIDHFMAYNDHFGHDKGDETLKLIFDELFHCLSGLTQANDPELINGFLMEAQSDEYSILLIHPGNGGMDSVIAKVQERLNLLRIPNEHPEAIVKNPLSLSYGYALDSDIAGSDIARLIESAQIALYHAKRKGRDRIERFEQDR